jgi:hypothetical protein
LLVLAVDTSSSIASDEAEMQREGYCRGLSNPEVLAAIADGFHGAVGVAYVEWSGVPYQRLVLPWTRITSTSDAAAWSATLNGQPRSYGGGGTSIAGSIDFSRRVIAQAPWQARFRVIDISGDGINNGSLPVQDARDQAVTEGITINGLTIEDNGRGHDDIFEMGGDLLSGQAEPIADYYRKAVIGGPSAFVVEAHDFWDFSDAVRRKLVREIAGMRHRYVDVHQRMLDGDRPILHGSLPVPRFQHVNHTHTDYGMAEAAAHVA